MAGDDAGKAPPSTLHLVDCANMPELNGQFDLTDEFVAFDADHAVYRRAAKEEAATVAAVTTDNGTTVDGSSVVLTPAGSKRKTLFMFYWKFSAVRRPIPICN